jgi:cytochrome oxidase Cu insertion factor (SCO1/SenC/PrrC family)
MKPNLSTTALAALIMSVCAAAQGQVVLPPDENATVGSQVPSVWFLDENGDTLRLGELSSVPLIVSPVFTTCPHACPAISSSLVSALADVGGAGKTFNVLTLSFDPEDTAEDLQRYRDRIGMPPAWIVANGTPDQVDPFLEALDFRYAPLPGGGYAHPNVVAVLGPGLTIRSYLHGLMYTEEEVKAALRAASGRRPLIEAARPWLLVVAALALVAALLTIALTKRRAGASG